MSAEGSREGPDLIDRHVGRRVRMRRLLMGMTQEKLGEAIGVSFQQVRTYEEGMNRIGSGRLHQIATVLGVPVSYFYEDAPGGDRDPEADERGAVLTAALTDPLALRLVSAFAATPDPEARRSLVNLAEAIAAPEGGEGSRERTASAARGSSAGQA